MSNNPNRSKRYTDEFKLNIIKLTEQGKGALEIFRRTIYYKFKTKVRGSLVDNVVIDNILNKYEIKRSLSKKESPYDNTVVGATYKIVKTEFVNNNNFETEEQLALDIFEYVNWYNNFRIHNLLNYLTPIKFKENVRKKVV